MMSHQKQHLRCFLRKMKDRSEHVLLECNEGLVDLESLCNGFGTLCTDLVVKKANK